MPEVISAPDTAADTAADIVLRLPGQGARRLHHLLAWVLLMLLCAWLLGPLKSVDWWLVDRLDTRAKPWPAGVEIVDLGWDMDPAGLEAFRRKLAAALLALAALPEPPRVVVVDVALSTLPLALSELNQAVEALKKRHVLIVATADLDAFVPGLDFDAGLARQGGGPEIYAGRALFGHTYLEFNGNSHWYRPCLAVPTLAEGDCLKAVPYVIGAKMLAPDEAVQSLPPSTRPVLFQPGPPGQLDRHSWRLADGQVLQSVQGDRGLGALAHAVVILGNPVMDLVNGRSGPELLAWAIGVNTSTSPPEAPRLVVLTELHWTLGFTLAFSLLALAVFALAQRVLTHPERHLVALAVGSAVFSLAALTGWVAMLRLGMAVVYPQISYVALAIVLTTGLAWRVLRAELREKAMYTSVAGPARAGEKNWDVFISYSHTPAENMDWVERELYAPLKRAVRGEAPLEVFFDKRSIGFGTAWYFELAEAIERSQCVVAVYSSDYFSKNFCTFELGKAVVREIATRGKRETFFILPVMRGQVSVPPAFSHLQFNVTNEPAALVAEVLRRLGASPPHEC